MPETPDGTPSTHDMRLVYKNHRGKVGARHIVPRYISFGTTDHHRTPQWLLNCYDLEKEAERTYALADCDFRAMQP